MVIWRVVHATNLGSQVKIWTDFSFQLEYVGHCNQCSMVCNNAVMLVRIRSHLLGYQSRFYCIRVENTTNFITWLWYENSTVPFTGFTLVERVSLQNLLKTSLLNLSCKWKILWFQFKISICCIWSWDFLLNFLEVRISCNFEDLISYFWYWIPQFLNVDGRVICFFGKRGWVKNLKLSIYFWDPDKWLSK